MSMTIEELEQEVGKLPEKERRRLIDRLQASLISIPKKRVSLRGTLTGSKITDEDLEAAKRIWR
jgi:hypothetical protein